MNMENTKERPRAVFAQSDYELIRNALMFYMTYSNHLNDENKRTAALRLYHRLGRVDNK